MAGSANKFQAASARILLKVEILQATPCQTFGCGLRLRSSLKLDSIRLASSKRSVAAGAASSLFRLVAAATAPLSHGTRLLVRVCQQLFAALVGQVHRVPTLTLEGLVIVNLVEPHMIFHSLAAGSLGCQTLRVRDGGAAGEQQRQCDQGESDLLGVSLLTVGRFIIASARLPFIDRRQTRSGARFSRQTFLEGWNTGLRICRVPCGDCLCLTSTRPCSDLPACPFLKISVLSTMQ